MKNRIILLVYCLTIFKIIESQNCEWLNSYKFKNGHFDMLLSENNKNKLLTFSFNGYDTICNDFNDKFDAGTWLFLSIDSNDNFSNANIKKYIHSSLKLNKVKLLLPYENGFLIAGVFSKLQFEHDTLVSKGEFDSYFAKIDLQGNIIWIKTLSTGISSGITNYIHDVQKDKDNNLYIVGYCKLPFYYNNDILYESNNSDIVYSFIIKIDSNGNLLFKKISNMRFYTLTIDNNNNPIFLALNKDSILHFNNDTIYYDNTMTKKNIIIKLSEGGELLWRKIWKDYTSDSGNYQKYSVHVTSDANNNIYTNFPLGTGTYYLDSTLFYNPFLNSSLVLTKLNANGVIIWSSRLSGTCINHSCFIGSNKLNFFKNNLFIYTHFGNNLFLNDSLIYSDTTIYDINRIVKINTEGKIDKVYTVNGQYYYDLLVKDSSFIFSGFFNKSIICNDDIINPYDSSICESNFTANYFVQKINFVPDYSPLINNIMNNALIYPNPASNNINVVLFNESKTNKLSIYNITGTILKREHLVNKENIINVSDLPKGIYIFKIESENEQYIKKVIIN